jgi:hypothetical protein
VPQSFNGVSDQVVNSSFSINASNAFTMHGWFNPAPAQPLNGGYGAISSIGGHADVSMYRRTNTGLDQNSAFYYGASSNDPGSGNFPYNVWSDMAMVFNGTTCQNYLNNVAAGNFTPTGLGTVTGFYIGNDNMGGFFKGQLAEIAVWSVALAASDLTALFNQALANTIQPASLMLYLSLGGLGVLQTTWVDNEF